LALGAVDFLSKPPHAALVQARVSTYQRLKQLSDTLRSVVQMDFLTGTMTRRQLEKALTQEWLRAQRSTAPIAVLLADVDGFTAYNGEFGEDSGDACLRAVADALRSSTQRPTDVLGRYSGGKFALLLPETDALNAGVIAQRAIVAVDALQMRHAASTGRHHISLSVGGGCRDAPASSNTADASNLIDSLAGAVPDDLLAAAEQALKDAKSAGGHQAKLIDVAELANGKSVSLN
jgi:diguanylate cyclase (GGDEF)-like protein